VTAAKLGIKYLGTNKKNDEWLPVEKCF